MNIEQLQDEMIQAVRSLSEEEEAGTLTHEQWSSTLKEYEGKIEQLSLPDQALIDTELFYPIEPEKS